MSVSEQLASLIGRWQGSNRLWLSPSDPVRESAGTAQVTLIAQRRFLTVHYTWADQDQPQDGLLTISLDKQTEQNTAAWVDSWHMGNNFLICADAQPIQGTIAAKGFYPAPPGPDWGWQLELVYQSAEAFKLLMYNFPPNGDAELAVEASYTRQDSDS